MTVVVKLPVDALSDLAGDYPDVTWVFRSESRDYHWQNAVGPTTQEGEAKRLDISTLKLQ